MPAIPSPPQGYDLLEQHLGQADLDIVHLEAEVGAAAAARLCGCACAREQDCPVACSAPVPRLAAPPHALRTPCSAATPDTQSPARPPPRPHPALPPTLPPPLQLQSMGMGVDAMGGVSVGGPDYSGGTFDDPAPNKRAGSRLRDVPSFDSFEQAAPEPPKRERR